MSNKFVAVLMIAIIALSVVSGCVEKNKNASAFNNNSAAISASAPKLHTEAVPLTVVVTPTSQPEQKIPDSEEPQLTISSPEIVSPGEQFAATLALKPQANKKIVAVEAKILSSDGKISATSMEIISSSPEADKVIQEGTISYANVNGISGDFAIIKFSAVQKGQAEIVVKATAIDENQFSAELITKKTIKIV